MSYVGKRRWTLMAIIVIAFILLLSVIITPGSSPQKSADPSAIAIKVDSYDDRWAVVPHVEKAPTLEELSDEWQSAHIADGFVTMYHHDPAAENTELYFLYHEQNLYIGLKGYKDHSVKKQVNTEIIEIVLAAGQGDRRSPAYRLRIPITQSGRPISTNWGDTVQDLSGATVRTNTFDDHWTIQTRIPLQQIGLNTASTGDAISMNVMRFYGVNSKPFTSWVPIRHSYISDTGGAGVSFVAHLLNQGRLGTLYLGQLPSEIVGSGSSTPFVNRSPAEWELRYTGYETKEFLFATEGFTWENAQLRFTWISPKGIRTPLDELAVRQDGEKTAISFHHPRPLEPGQYRLQLTVQENDATEPSYYTELSFDREALIRAGDQLVLATLPPRNVNKTREVELKPPSQTVQNLMALIPENTGFIFTGLPENSGLLPYQLYDWSASKPTQIVAKSTGTVYPNDTYPEVHHITVTNRKGETIQYPYYEDKDGKKYFFTAHVWYFQKDYALRETEKVSQSDPLGAARLLVQWADVYEGYLPTNDYYWTNYPLTNSDPPYHYWGGMWYRWYTGEMTNMSYLLHAYRNVRQSNAFELLSDELGYDVEERIVSALFEPSFEYVRTFPVLNHNMEYTTWLGLIRMGRASGNSSYIHEAVELIQDFAANNFLSDGFWKEVTLSYHNQSTNGLLASMNELRGWTDPEEYISPRTGQRLEGLDMIKMYPVMSNAQNMKHIASYPNGSYVPIQDTWANEKTTTPRTDLGSYLLTGSGISRLTLGEGLQQQQAWLTYAPKYGHNHLDPLNLNLFAQRQELLPDIGYTHSLYRSWSTSTLAHNTVVVDAKDMVLNEESKHGGNVQAFLAMEDGVQIVKAEQQAAYPTTSEYSREVWLNPFGDGEAPSDGYVVDIFRVTGGHQHEYTLNGDANVDGQFVTNLPLTSYGERLLPGGTIVTLPELETQRGTAGGHYHGYIYVEDVERAEITDGQYEVKLETYDGQNQKSRLNITGFIDEGNNELFIGQSPSLRLTRLNGRARDTNTDAVKYYMPKMVVRRSGDSLESTFVHIMEAHTAVQRPRIERVEKLIPDQSVSGDIALKITYGSTTDIILSSTQGESPLVIGDIELIGTQGWIRLVDGVPTRMVLTGGTLLRYGDHVMNGEGSMSGTITGVLRKAAGDRIGVDGTNMGSAENAAGTASTASVPDSAGALAQGDGQQTVVDAFVVGEKIPAEMIGHAIIITHPDGSTNGYIIKDIVEKSELTYLVLDTEPGWELLTDGSSRMTSYPLKTWHGAHSYRIDNVVVK